MQDFFRTHFIAPRSLARTTRRATGRHHREHRLARRVALRPSSRAGEVVRFEGAAGEQPFASRAFLERPHWLLHPPLLHTTIERVHLDGASNFSPKESKDDWWDVIEQPYLIDGACLRIALHDRTSAHLPKQHPAAMKRCLRVRRTLESKEHAASRVSNATPSAEPGDALPLDCLPAPRLPAC